MKFEVERFERGTDLTIKDWINQMETSFTIGQVPIKAFVGVMLMKIVPRHLSEINHYQSLNYLAFREMLVEVFEEPDIANESPVYLKREMNPSPTTCIAQDYSYSRLILTLRMPHESVF